MRQRRRSERLTSRPHKESPPSDRTRNRAPGRRPRARKSASLIRLLPIFAALLAATVFLSWTEGGRSTRLADPMALQLDRLAEGIGLGLQEITIGGHRRTREQTIYKAMELDKVRSFVRFDSEAVRRRIEELPWIDRAQIRRSFPWRIEVRVTERTPFALWRHEGSDTIIDRSGRHLEVVEFGRVRSLPLVAGLGAEHVAHEIIDAVARWPDLLLATALARRVGSRRWDLILSGSRRIQLPARNITQALKDLMSGSRGQRLFDQQFAEADFRLANQVTLRRRALSKDRYDSPGSQLSRRRPLPSRLNRS